VLPLLHAAQRDGWHHLVTGDEFWFLWYITTSDVDSVERWCDHKTETANSEQTVYVYDYMESDCVLCCQKASKWYQNEQRLLCHKYAYSSRTSDLSSRKGAASKTTCHSSRQLLSSHESNLNRVARITWHVPHPTATLFAWSGLQ
jgi:uncharacterized protein involved in type VI secretion and phage assembly